MNYQRGKGYLLVLAVLLGGCVVTPAPPYYSDEQVMVAPPLPRVEYLGPPPVADYVWIGGYWSWAVAERRHLWVPGYWSPPRPGHRWEPHRWEREGPHWRERRGRWGRG